MARRCADVTISGNGRFGLLYQETDFDNDNETTICYRLRFNIDATKETDSGVTFGGRIRMQYDSATRRASPVAIEQASSTGSTLIFTDGLARRFAERGPDQCQVPRHDAAVGNVDTAYDSAALMYNSEIGFLDRSSGDPQGSYFSYSSSPMATSRTTAWASFFGYSVGEFNVRFRG